MSQIIKNGSGGSIPPTVAQSYVTDDGTAIPSASILNVNGVDSIEDSTNGILTRANPNLSQNLQIVLTNRLSGTATSTNASTEDLVTFPLASTDSCYRFEFMVCGRDTTSGDTVGYTVLCSAKTDGLAASVVATPFVDADEDASLITATIDFVASGNSVILQVTGVVLTTISYKSVGSYTVV